MSGHPHCKEFFPNVQPESPLAQLYALPVRPVTGHQGEGTCISLSTSLAQ